MARRHKAEEIIGKLREAELVLNSVVRWQMPAAG